jgi:hypothetical protein
MPAVPVDASKRDSVQATTEPRRSTSREPQVDLDAIKFADTCTRLSWILRRIRSDGRLTAGQS